MTRVSIFVTTLLSLCFNFCLAQYAPQAPLPGHQGIRYDSPLFTDWASGCTLYRGWKDIADKSIGHTTLGSEADVYGEPGSNLVSLGDSGVAVVTFPHSIFNGDGPDFAVFENAFANPENDTLAYLEFAFAEVSSDGLNFFRFPASSKFQDTLQIDNFTYSDARLYHNLAGKYIAGYGTSFDLEELKNTPGLDVNNITHVRIVDVIGTINSEFASHDIEGNIINDPYPSAFPSGGFDLNGIGVINSNQTPTGINEPLNALKVKVFPNPSSGKIHLRSEETTGLTFRLTDISGRTISQGVLNKNASLDLTNQLPGMYLLYLGNEAKRNVFKLIRQ